MPFVLDCSMTMAWVFPDEADETTAVLRDALVEDYAVVPSLWPIEVANVILAATRRRRINETHAHEVVGYLSALPIRIDAETAEYVFHASLPLAQQYDLSVYDAVYLELALRQNLPLATLDKKLKAACAAAGGRLT